MITGLLGKKMGMAGIFSTDGKYIPVTVVQAGPCFITQIKTIVNDGYNALQLGFGDKRKSRLSKPIKGHLKKSGKGFFKVLREFSIDHPSEYKLGNTISLDLFKIGELIDISGTIKGRGFAGVIKRHGFHGGADTHGSHSHRVPGSIGCSAWPAKVVKGKKMPGHYGNKRDTIKNLEIIDIRPEENLILIKGSIPGFSSGLVEIRKKRLPK